MFDWKIRPAKGAPSTVHILIQTRRFENLFRFADPGAAAPTVHTLSRVAER